jgi:biopolymer transport protein ExbD
MPRRRRRIAEINIVPLVDVLVVLIFFFLVSMQFRSLTTLQLDLPEIESAGEERQTQQVEIAIAEEGTIYFNGEVVDEETLANRLRLVARVDPKTPILIMADEASFLRYTTLVMDLCRLEGLQTLRLQSR